MTNGGPADLTIAAVQSCLRDWVLVRSIVGGDYREYEGGNRNKEIQLQTNVSQMKL